jgi:hypothetical protein
MGFSVCISSGMFSCRHRPPVLDSPRSKVFSAPKTFVAADTVCNKKTSTKPLDQYSTPRIASPESNEHEQLSGFQFALGIKSFFLRCTGINAFA